FASGCQEWPSRALTTHGRLPSIERKLYKFEHHNDRSLSPTCAASNKAGTRLRMTARSILDLFPASRNAPRESHLYRHPTLRATPGGLPKTDPDSQRFRNI